MLQYKKYKDKTIWLMFANQCCGIVAASMMSSARKIDEFLKQQLGYNP